MSNRRFYWLKLKEDFFEDDTIQWLEEQENGVEYTLFYLKLCLKSLKNDGKLVRFVGDYLMPYDKKTLAKLTNTDADTVAVAMDLFKKIGLIDIFESGEIYMKQIEEMVGSETASAVRKRRSRARLENDATNQIEHSGQSRDNVTPMSKNVTESKSIEKELDKEIDIEQEKEKEQITSSTIHRFYQDNFGVASSYIIEDLHQWIDDLSPDLVLLALKKAIEKNAEYSYAKGIMKNWAKKGIKSLEDAEAEGVARARHTGYQNNSQNRVESVPDWAKDGYQQTEDEIDEDAEARKQEMLSRISRKRGASK